MSEALTDIIRLAERGLLDREEARIVLRDVVRELHLPDGRIRFDDDPPDDADLGGEGG